MYLMLQEVTAYQLISLREAVPSLCHNFLVISTRNAFVLWDVSVEMV